MNEHSNGPWNAWEDICKGLSIDTISKYDLDKSNIPFILEKTGKEHEGIISLTTINEGEPKTQVL